MTGNGKNKAGVLNHSFGGAFLVPFASRITGEVAPDGHSLTTTRRGKTITLPLNSGTYATHGLFNLEKVQDLQVRKTKEGETITGVSHAGEFGAHWLSKTDLHFTIVLAGDAVDISITAKNAGKIAEPMGIGGHPYFAIPSGDRGQVRLHVPAERRALVNDTDARTTGDFQSLAGTDFDFRAPEGGFLNDSINANFSAVGRNFAASLIDPKSNYGRRVRALSANPDAAGLLAEEQQLCGHRGSIQLSRPLGCGMEGDGHRDGDSASSAIRHLAREARAICTAANRQKMKRPAWRIAVCGSISREQT